MRMRRKANLSTYLQFSFTGVVALPGGVGDCFAGTNPSVDCIIPVKRCCLSLALLLEPE